MQKAPGRPLFNLSHLLVPGFEALAKATQLARQAGMDTSVVLPKPSLMRRVKNKVKRLLEDVSN
ncbi:hypothetical protein D3C83_259800 [compost metagenome]